MSRTSRRLWVCVIPAVLCFAGLHSAFAQTPTKSPVAKSELEGTWDGELSIGGGRTRTFTPGEMWVTFKGDIAVGKAFLAPEGIESRFEVDSKATPKHFDFIQSDGGPIRGIYQIEGDALTIVISFTGTRPSGFKESDQTFRVSILKLKRRK